MSKFITAFAAAAVAAAVLPAAANAATLVVDVAGIETFTGLEGPGNTVLTYNLGAGAVVTDFAYNVSITAFSPSYLSEVAIYFTNTAVTEGVVVNPGFGEDAPGTATYSDSFNLAAEDLAFNLGADGVLRIEFTEDFDDTSVSPDAIFNSGTLTFTYTPGVGAVPEPASWAMLISGFGLVGGTLRRRQKVSVRYA